MVRVRTNSRWPTFVVGVDDVCFAVTCVKAALCEMKLNVSNCVQRVREEQMFCAGGEEANRCRISS